jgi:hypothetical protein
MSDITIGLLGMAILVALFMTGIEFCHGDSRICGILLCARFECRAKSYRHRLL